MNNWKEFLENRGINSEDLEFNEKVQQFGEYLSQKLSKEIGYVGILETLKYSIGGEIFEHTTRMPMYLFTIHDIPFIVFSSSLTEDGIDDLYLSQTFELLEKTFPETITEDKINKKLIEETE